MITRVNLELKYFCHDFKPIRRILEEMGAKKSGFKKQKDYFFFMPSARKNVRMKFRNEGKNQEIVYYERPNFETNKNISANVLVYIVKDKELFNFLKSALGVKGMVEKKRETWKKDDTVFNLDVVKNVGKVFEIELQKPKTQSTTKQDIKFFNSYKQKFLPYLGAMIKTSNLELVLKK
jgi:adenylate cyclase class IV